MEFLNQIDDYIRKSGIPFKNIEISYSYLPLYYDYAITSIIRETLPTCYELTGCEKYSIEYDDDNNIYLKAISRDKRTTLIIYSEYAYCNYAHGNIIGKKISEVDVYKKACLLKKRQSLKNKIDSFVDKYFASDSDIERIKKKFELIDEVALDDMKNTDFIKDEELDMQLDKTISLIKNYIEYLNIAYQEDTKAYNNANAIKYNPSKKDTIIRRNINSHKENKERVNNIISMDERSKVLINCQYRYFSIAYSQSSSIADYYCYLYYDNMDIPVLILEPYSGTNYTRVVYLEPGLDYTKEEFQLQCKKYLEMSNQEALDTKRVVRFNHTNIEEFNKIINLIVNGEEEKTRYNPNKLERIKKITNNL